MTFKVRISYKDFGKVLQSEEMLEAVVTVAEKIKTQAEANSPVETGHYKESFHIDSTRKGGKKSDRATATVYNDAEYAATVEFGNRNKRAHHPLGRASDAR